jgi:dihydrofolate reductase
MNQTPAPGRQLIVSENMTANGVIEFVDEWFHPDHHTDDELLELQRQQMTTETALILGRSTFEDFRAYWVQRPDDDTGSTEHLNSVAKYLVTSTLTEPGWENTTIVPPTSLIPQVQKLKSDGSGDLGITGSITVVHALLEADLVDEIRLFIYPVVTGQGRNLIPTGLPTRKLKLSTQRQFTSGVVFQSYSRQPAV